MGAQDPHLVCSIEASGRAGRQTRFYIRSSRSQAASAALDARRNAITAHSKSETPMIGAA
jgi:hypothetical protein